MSDATKMTAPVIRFADVHKSFGDKVVLDGFSMELHRGRTLAIMGPSGVGKSVTLKHAIGLLTADSGSVHVFDQEIGEASQAELAQVRTRMGYVFQESALINWLTVAENLALPLEETTDLKPAEISDRVAHTLGLVHIPDAADKFPNEISGGMKKRVGLARELFGANCEWSLISIPKKPLLSRNG